MPVAGAVQSVENNLHWVLGTLFNDDRTSICESFSADDLAMIRLIALSCLQKRQ